jgi:hypothetical protein
MHSPEPSPVGRFNSALEKALPGLCEFIKACAKNRKKEGKKMSLETFKPEDAYKGVLNELRRAMECKLDVRIFSVPKFSDEIFVRVTEYSDAVPISAQRVSDAGLMNRSIGGFGGCLADMIRSCRFEVEATKKKCDAQMQFPFEGGT